MQLFIYIYKPTAITSSQKQSWFLNIMANEKTAAKNTPAANDTANTTTTAPAATENKTAAPAPEPTSPKLDELKTQREAAKAAVNAAFSKSGDYDAKEVVDARNELARVDSLIKAEKAAIVTAENKAKLDEARNKRAAMVDSLLEAAGIKAPYSEAVTAQRELIVNELLAKFSTPKTGGSGNSNASKTTGNKAEATALHIANKAAGMDDAASRKAIEAAGIPRSTAWHAVNDYNKANAS